MAAMPRPRRKTWRFALSAFAGFALGQLALGTAIDCLAPVRDPEVESKLARLCVRRAEAPGRPLVVVLGSSRTAYGLDAASLSRDSGALVFNFGIMGSGPLMHLVNLRRLLAVGVRPDLLYVEVMPPLLADLGLPLEEKLLEASRLRLGELLALRRYSHGSLRLLRHWCMARVLPGGAPRAGLHSYVACDSTDIAPGRLDGYGWRERLDDLTEKDRREGVGLARRQYSAPCAVPYVAAGSRRALEDLLALGCRKGIAVRLLLMPEGKGFRALYSPPARQALTALLTQLRARWGVDVVDARSWVGEAGFWDTHHLLAEGARCFTERLSREALTPALAELSRQRRGTPTELSLPTPLSRR
jgi:hypothetical protein